jgi:hypothetical protein
MPIKSILARQPETAIKLGGLPPDNPALAAFLKEFDKGTTPNPFQPRMRVWKDSVGVELGRFSGMIHISSIMSFIEKNAGQASACLKWICDLADKHQVKLDLTVSPIKNAGAREGKSLTKPQLTAWYTRAGFVKGRGDAMQRDPR